MSLEAPKMSEKRMAKTINFLSGYLQARHTTYPRFRGFIAKSYVLKSMLIILFAPLRQTYKPREIFYSGNQNRRFFKNVEGYGEWGVTTITDRPSLDIGRLYIATTLYVFVSRRFARTFRAAQQSLRKTVKRNPPRIIFIHSDALPAIRALILTLRPLGCKFICVQHGLFHDCLEGQIDGIYSDLIVALRTDQLGHFYNSGATNILDYSAINEPEDTSTHGDAKFPELIVLVGEGRFKVSREKDQELIGAYRYIYKKLKSMGVAVRYRPHPSERSNWLKYLQLLVAFGWFHNSDSVQGKLFIGANSSFIAKQQSNGGVVHWLNLRKDESKQSINSLLAAIGEKDKDYFAQPHRSQYVDCYDVRTILSAAELGSSK